MKRLLEAPKRRLGFPKPLNETNLRSDDDVDVDDDDDVDENDTASTPPLLLLLPLLLLAHRPEWRVSNTTPLAQPARLSAHQST